MKSNIKEDYLAEGTCFIGMEKMKMSDFPSLYKFSKECPRCHAHGGWVLKLDAYGKGKHFKVSCGACWGFGFIQESQCLHRWERSKNIAMCLSEWSCIKCGQRREVDSSG